MLARTIYTEFTLNTRGFDNQTRQERSHYFYASFKIDWDSQCVNMWSDPRLEPEIKYGTTFLRHLQRIWNLRISYPNRDLYLWDDDIAGAFR